MTVKVVTDSTADLPPDLVEEFNIEIVPAYTRFGEEVFKDGVDISRDQFYKRLLSDAVHPSTIQPSPQDFIDVFNRLAKQGAEGIISVNISSPLSGTYNSALQAKEAVTNKIPVAVVDTRFVSMAEGILVLEAARMARNGKKLEEITTAIEQKIPKIKLLICFDTLKYLALGGRIGKVKALLGSVLNVKPIVVIKDGVLVPAGQVRTRKKGIEKLVEFARSAENIQELAVIHSTTPDVAAEVADAIGEFFPRDNIYITQLGSAVGVHAGPGVLGVGIREG